MSKIKETLKRNKYIFETHQKWQKIKFRMVSQMSVISPEWVSKIRYKNIFGTDLELNHP